MRTDDFNYILPEELIASRPLAERSASRMMVIDRKLGTIEHRHIGDIVHYKHPNDLFVFNDTKVVPARYFSDDGTIEIVRTELLNPTLWKCLVRPGKKMREGKTISIGGTIGTVLEIDDEGNRLIEFTAPIDEDKYGRLALPHYMNRESDPEDKERYQTVYAKEEGAIAAPTAGLHFTPELLAQLPHCFVTLHVGVGTFRPVKAEYIEDHSMHKERYILSDETAKKINQAQRRIAVGTTSVRVLESTAKAQGLPLSGTNGNTDIFIYPPYQFQLTDVLLTNFHLPQSTLLMLVSAFAGKELIMNAYHQAIEHKYRFFSYGDCMLIL